MKLLQTLRTAAAGLRRVPKLPANDLLRDRSYRRLWLSILCSSFGAQLTGLALPLVSVLLLQATPAQMGVCGACGVLPFILFSIPSGVWLERVRKLPVYLAGELALALVLIGVTVAWALDRLTMPLMYGVAFVAGCVAVTSGTVAQIVLTQVVPRARLVEAYGRNATANSTSEVVGPAVAGFLIKFAGVPFSLLVNALLLVVSVLILRRVRPLETPTNTVAGNFWKELKEGVRFVAGNRLLMSMALAVGAWQVFQTSAMVVQVLFATRELGLRDYQLGLCYAASGVGTVAFTVVAHRISRRLGPGPCLLFGFALSGGGWLQLALTPTGTWGVAAYVAMLLCFSAGTVLIFINMLALRQAITPAPLLARMTGTMRWLTLLPAAPGALLGGYLGEQFGLRQALAFGGLGALLLAALVWRFTAIRRVSSLPAHDAARPPDAGVRGNGCGVSGDNR